MLPKRHTNVSIALKAIVGDNGNLVCLVVSPNLTVDLKFTLPPDCQRHSGYYPKLLLL